jgi:hypothetical protein
MSATQIVPVEGSSHQPMSDLSLYKKLPSETPMLSDYLRLQVHSQFFLAALFEIHQALLRLELLKTTHLSKVTANLIRTASAFSSLQSRLSRNNWFGLDSDEKRQRQEIAAHREKRKLSVEAQNHLTLQDQVSRKVYRAHQASRSIRLSKVEELWLRKYRPDFSEFCTIKNGFISPHPLARKFDFTKAAYEQLGKRLIYGMLSPVDCELLTMHNIPIENGVVILKDASWQKEVHAKMSLYRIIKARQSLSQLQASEKAELSIKSFRRIELDDELSASVTKPALLPPDSHTLKPELSYPTPIRAELKSPTFKRVSLEIEESVPDPIVMPNNEEPMQMANTKDFLMSLLVSKRDLSAT